MKALDIWDMVKAKPFVPFKLQAVDGVLYEVRHPEMILVTLSTVIVTPPPGPEGLPERIGDVMSIEHIARIIRQPPVPATT